jgi:DNA/RNA endonuclease YhcR with UshA esterase domain
MKKLFVLVALTLLASQVAWAAKPKGIEAKYAFQRVGKTVTVCGDIASAKYLQGSGREPTFLNFADTYRKHPFTVVIWGDTRAQFDYPPETLNGRSICVRGLIETYRSKPQIVVTSPAQITVVDGE